MADMAEVIKVDCDEDVYADDTVARVAFEYFKIPYLFPWQRMVIENILEAYRCVKNKEDESDNFCRGRQIVLLPTGAGKSLCFQIPALLLEGPTLVIYPLLALMADQQRRMEEANVQSVIFRGGQSEEVRESGFDRIRSGAKIIIANPEVLQNEGLLEQLCALNICHIAIDEAHCVCEWGDSFRPSYLKLKDVIKKISPPVITAFTATASPTVLSRVSELLFDGEANVLRSESDRQNIHYFVKKCASKKPAALFLAKTERRPMIIFCGTRHGTEDMAQELNVCFGKGTARFYHAGIQKEEKDDVEKWFFNSTDGILCATCAYGMGVDKKDIRTVIHADAPKTAEAYIQEAGRGGRDGEVAKAILLWSLQDDKEFSIYEKGSREGAMKTFASGSSCRRQALLDALGAEKAVCSGCDICTPGEFTSGICDWEEALKTVRRGRYFYDELALEEEIFKRMNDFFLSALGLKIWNHTDSAEVVEQILAAKKIAKRSGRLWKNRFYLLK